MGSYFSRSKFSSSSIISTSTPIRNQDDSLILNPYTNKIHEINTEDQFYQLINNKRNINLLIVCDFYASWCMPCLQIAPIIHTWAMNDYKTNVIFMKINVDNNNELSNKFSIEVLPTIILFKQGKEIFRLTGTDSIKLKREIDKFK